MRIKNFNEYLIKENILNDEGDEYTWGVKVDGEIESYWEYKHDAIDQILEILDTQGDENDLAGYVIEDNYAMSKNEIADMLDDLDESDFYKMLDELKEFVGYNKNIKLVNIADQDELEFLEED